MFSRALTLSCIALGSVLAAPATADTITLASGETIDDVNITEETLKSVFYRKGGSTRDVDADKVVSISYDEFPSLVEKAESLVDEGDIEGAVSSYTLYVEGQIENPTERKDPWAPAYAAFRAVELNRGAGQFARVVDAADLLIGNFADSRFVPATYLAKAEAQRYSGQADAAKATLQSLASLVEREGLSQRYAFDAELALLEIDQSLSADERLKRAKALGSRAGSAYPTVRMRAELLEGQTLVRVAEAASDADAQNTALDQAMAKFDGLIASDAASDSVRAGAYVGRGDVLFFRAAPKDDVEGLKAAGHEYLKVTVLYPGERAHLLRALFFGGRCFHQIGALTASEVDQARAQRIFQRLRNTFPNSPMAAESRKFR